MTTIEWRAPAPTWSKDSLASTVALRPGIALCHGDSFLDDFLALMQGTTAGKTPQALSDALLPTSAPQKLFQPAHGCYYLIVGSLVCRQLGLPDRMVSRAAGESAAFVVRRLVRDDAGALLQSNGIPIEQAWVNDGTQRGWHSLSDPAKLYDGEERLPMHHVDTCAAFTAGQSAFADAFGLSECGRRTVYYGYVPVANREKYTERRALPASANPAEEFQKFVAAVIASGETGHDPRKDDVEEKIIKPWRGLYHNPITGSGDPDPITSEARGVFSLYLLLDLLDQLSTNLPTVSQALTTNDGSQLQGARRDLFTALHAINVTKIAPSTPPTTSSLPLHEALKELQPYLALVRTPEDDSAVEPDTYDALIKAYNLPTGDPNLGNLQAKWNAALNEEKDERIANNLPWLPTPSSERFELLRDQVVPKDTTGEELYVLRTVYEHAPCCPVLSAPTGQVLFAKFYDPDAPARHIRIELPSIKPRDLRKYKRGVGLEMSPELRNLMNQVNKGMLKGEGLGSGAGLQLGMICSFSLQIIFLVAFIVMFIFLILLNIIFWWMAFLKICFPIPIKGK